MESIISFLIVLMIVMLVSQYKRNRILCGVKSDSTILRSDILKLEQTLEDKERIISLLHIDIKERLSEYTVVKNQLATYDKYIRWTLDRNLQAKCFQLTIFLNDSMTQLSKRTDRINEISELISTNIVQALNK